MTEFFLWRLTVGHVLSMAKIIHTNVKKKLAHCIPRRGWGIAWECFGSVAKSVEHSTEFLVTKKCGELLDSLRDSSSLNRGYSQWAM